jgi:Spy/CpxP family protein refolding chaperone
MKTKTLTISVLLLAVVLAPLAMAADEDYAPRRGPHGGQRGPRGPRGGQCGPEQGPGGFGGQHGMRQGNMGQFLLGRMGDRLELTDEQRTEIEGIVESCKEDAEAIRDAIQEAMKALHETATEGTEEEIAAAGKAVGDAFTQQALKRAKTAKQIKEVLTEEQQAQLKELKVEMKEKMQQRRKEGGQGGKRGQGGRRQGGRQGRGGRQRPPQD